MREIYLFAPRVKIKIRMENRLEKDLEKASIAIRNKKEDKGSPWRIPLLLAKNPVSSPFTLIESIGAVMQALMHLKRVAGVPIANNMPKMQSNLIES